MLLHHPWTSRHSSEPIETSQVLSAPTQPMNGVRVWKIQVLQWARTLNACPKAAPSIWRSPSQSTPENTKGHRLSPHKACQVMLSAMSSHLSKIIKMHFSMEIMQDSKSCNGRKSAVLSKALSSNNNHNHLKTPWLMSKLTKAANLSFNNNFIQKIQRKPQWCNKRARSKEAQSSKVKSRVRKWCRALCESRLKTKNILIQQQEMRCVSCSSPTQWLTLQT